MWVRTFTLASRMDVGERAYREGRWTGMRWKAVDLLLTLLMLAALVIAGGAGGKWN